MATQRTVIECYDLRITNKNEITPFQITLFKFWILGGIHKLRWQARGRRGSPKCQRYFISLFNKVVNEGGGGSEILKILSTYFMDVPLHKIQPKFNLSFYIFHVLSRRHNKFRNHIHILIPVCTFYASFLSMKSNWMQRFLQILSHFFMKWYFFLE